MENKEKCEHNGLQHLICTNGAHYHYCSECNYVEKLPTTTVDELNLDEIIKDAVIKHFTGTSVDADIRELFMSGALFASKFCTHHNHASFVALVEGEIAELRREINSGVLSNAGRERNMLRIGVLNNLLTKIK